jgi:glucokinase-like ROK family protein
LEAKRPVVALEFVRELNKVLVLNLIRQERTISRTDIARRIHLSRSTVSAIVNDLLAEEWLVESGTGKSRGGRRPILLSFNYQAGYILGIDAGATHLLAAVTDLDAKVVAEIERPFDVSAGPEAGLETIVDIVGEILTETGLGLSQLIGIGVGLPGPLDYAHGTVVAPPIMPGWHNFPVRDRLEGAFGVPVYVDNDANLGALGEYSYGAGKGVDNLAFVKVATGIGCGIIVSGQIYHGQTGAAGEIGHVTMAEDGPPCTCGSYGCLEAMAGGPAIAQRAAQAIQVGQSTMLRSMISNGNLTAKLVEQAARQGDPLAVQLYADAGRLIGLAVANVINLLNPGRVIIGGGVSEAGELILASLRDTARQHSMRAAVGATDIVQAILGHRSSALGAVALVLQETFRSPAVDLVGWQA